MIAILSDITRNLFWVLLAVVVGFIIWGLTHDGTSWTWVGIFVALAIVSKIIAMFSHSYLKVKKQI